jgi:hypothetical protein
MAKIVASDEAPKGKVRFSLANEEIEKLPYKTDDREVLANAEAHPWLSVEYDKAEDLSALAGDLQLRPEDDVLSAQNSVAFDPKAIKDALNQEAASDPVAIDAGLDQTKSVETDSGVDLTVAAAEETSPDETTAKTSAAKKEN